MKYLQSPAQGSKLREGEYDMIFDMFRYVQARLNIKSERGAALVEYALLLALIAVVCIVAIGAIGTGANKKFSEVGSKIQ